MAVLLAAAGVVAIVPAVVGRAAADGSDLVVAVYGDSYSAGGRQGGMGSSGWPAIVADRLGADLRLHAAGGAGYVNGSTARDETFLDQVLAHPEPDADVVVLFGSRNDRSLPTSAVGRQAARVFDAVRTTSPRALVVVIGPAWDDDEPPAGPGPVRDAVAAAAGSAGLAFVDPLTDGWLRDRPDLIGADGVHPHDGGHAHLADLIEPAVGSALDDAPSSAR